MEKKKKNQGAKNLDTFGKRLLVLTLALLMTFQFSTASLSGVAFALSDAEAAEAQAIEEAQQTETVAAPEETKEVQNAPPKEEVKVEAPAPKEEVKEETPAPKEEVKTEEPKEEVKEETAEVKEEVKSDQADSETEVKEETSETSTEEQKEEVTETTEEVPVVSDEETPADETEEEEEAEDELNKESMHFEKTINRVTVNVTAEPGTFPEGTKMKVETVSKEDVRDAVEKAMGGEVNDFRAVDITFYTDKETDIQPLKPVKVQMTTKAFQSEEDLAVVHVEDPDKNKAEVMDLNTKQSDDTKAVFNTDGFSIYVVVDPGTEDSRIAIKFFKSTSDTTPIDTMYVKDNDTDNEIDTILYDPGLGETALSENQVFRGWTYVDLAGNTKKEQSIEDIRAYVKTIDISSLSMNQLSEGLKIYAQIYNVFTATYKDEGNTVIDSKPIIVNGDSVSYTLDQSYSPKNTNQQFQGWYISPTENATINGQPVSAGTAYPNGTELTLTGSVTLTVKAPTGAWLIFRENGSGADYTPPQFLEEGDVTEEPAEPHRLGYIFRGWYENAEGNGSQFTFGSTLSANKTLYAKWEQVSAADYVTIIWKQNLAGDGYDFEESIPGNGSVGTNIDTSDARNKNYPGFHLGTYDQNVPIVPQGNAVANVYYDRTQYTLTFQAPNGTYTSNGNTSASQADEDGEYYGRRNNGTYVRIYPYTEDDWRWGWVYYTNNGYINWWPNGSRTNSTTTYSANYSTVKTIQALYGQDISSNFPIVGTNGTSYAGYVWSPQNSSVYTTGDVPSIEQMQAENTTFRAKTYFNGIGSPTTAHMYYYTEAIGNEPAGTPTVQYGGKTYVEHQHVQLNTNGGINSTEAEDFIDIAGYSHNGSDPAYGSDGKVSLNDSNNYTIKFYYTRQNYQIHYMDAKYVDGDDKTIETKTGELYTSEAIAYGASIEDVYEPTAPAGFVFEGWFIDDACTSSYTFTTMPEGGITVYAKWRKIEYRVFLHPGVPTSETSFGDPSSPYGMGGQKTSFRVAYGESIDNINAKREDYDLIGWYVDPQFNTPFSFDAYVMNDNTVGLDDYDKDRSTETNTYGNPTESTNKDADRFWITKSLDLYAKWSAKLIGAEGITVLYDAGEGSNAPFAPNHTDPLLYKDNTNAVAGAASTAPDTDLKFRYWVVQKWNGSAFEDTNVHVYPGDTFTIKKNDAQVVENAGSTAENPSYTYTVKVRAEYGPADAETPTHIYWYANNGTQNKKADDNLKINEAVDIEPSTLFSYTGYKFKGWARYEENEAPASPKDDSKLWLVLQDGKFYEKKNGVVSTTEAKQVACDEKNPYHDLYAVWEPINYTVHFDKNATDATGTMADQAFEYDETKALTSNAFFRPSYKFLGWSTDANATTAAYTNNQQVKNLTAEDGATVTLYAVWELDTATVTVHHYLKGTTTKVAEDDVDQKTIGTEVDPSTVPAATSFLDTYSSYTLTKDSTDPTATVTVTANGAEITLYYTLPLTITVADKTSTYNGAAQYGYGLNVDEKDDQNNPVVTVEGLLTGDSISELNYTRATGTNAGTYTNGSFSADPTITNGTETVSYYTITKTAGKLTITPAGALTVTAVDYNQPYDAETHNGGATPSVTEGTTIQYSID